MMTANDVQVYATFRLEQDVLYRYHTYIQWGESETSLGACLMLNPGFCDSGSGITSAA